MGDDDYGEQMRIHKRLPPLKYRAFKFITSALRSTNKHIIVADSEFTHPLLIDELLKVMFRYLGPVNATWFVESHPSIPIQSKDKDRYKKGKL